MARDALRYYPELDAGGHALGAGRGDAADPARGRTATWAPTRCEQLRPRRIDIRLDTRLESCVDGDREALRRRRVPRPTRSSGRRASSRTRCSTRTDLPRDDRGPGHLPAHAAGRRRRPGRRRGRLERRRLRRGAGPHRPRCRGRCARRARSTRCARRRGWPTTSRRAAGRASRSTTSTSTSARWRASACYKGVAQVYGVKVRGLPAWFMHRTYHLSRIPTLNRKVRVVVDWTLALFLRARGRRAGPAARAARAVPDAWPRRSRCPAEAGAAAGEARPKYRQTQTSSTRSPGPSSPSMVCLQRPGVRVALVQHEGQPPASTSRSRASACRSWSVTSAGLAGLRDPLQQLRRRPGVDADGRGAALAVRPDEPSLRHGDPRHPSPPPSASRRGPAGRAAAPAPPRRPRARTPASTPR